MIEINNLTQTRANKSFLEKAAIIVLRGEKKKGDLSIALVGQKRIKELNRRYRKQNKPTDVLAFPKTGMGLGEVVISLQVVKKNAKKYGLSFKKELARVLIHGVLHLLGYHHEKTKKAAAILFKKEADYLSKL